MNLPINIDNEKIYDNEIAPALRELAHKCTEAGMSIFAIVEYSPGHIAETRMFSEGYDPIMSSMCKFLYACLLNSGYGKENTNELTD